MSIPSRLTSVLVLSCAPLLAQCPFSSVSTSPIGSSCNAASTGLCLIAATPTRVVAELDVHTCTLDVDVFAFSGCGATVPVRALAIGGAPASIPLPAFGATCTLQVTPDILLLSATGDFPLQLPSSMSSLSFFMQGYALSLPPVGAPIHTLSDGQSVSLQ